MTPREKEKALAAVAASPAAFRQALLIDADGETKRLAEVIDPWQRADFEALDPAWQSIAHGQSMPALRRAWIERPRGHSKTGDIAAMVSFCLAGSPRQLLGVVAAADQEQAGLIRDAIARLCALNWWLNDVLEVQRGRVINRRTDSELRVLSADAPSSFGLTPSFVICDEISIWPKRDLWDSLFSAAAKKGRCLLAVICNAGFETTWQWPLREAIRTDPNWYFNHLDGPQASWITEERLAEQRRLLPAIAYQRLWGNVWATGEGDALNPDDLAAAFSLDGPLDGPEKGWIYFLGGDLGTAHDASVLCVVGKHVGFVDSEPLPPEPLKSVPLLTRWAISTGEISEEVLTNSERCVPIVVEGTYRLKLAALSIFRPGAGQRVDLSEVEREVARLYSVFRFLAAPIDAWQAELLVTNSQKAGIPAELRHATGVVNDDIAMCVLSAFIEKRLSLWRHPALVADLKRLSIVPKGDNKVRLVSPKTKRGESTGHGDTCSALGLALVAARRFTWAPSRTIDRELICYP